MRYLFSCLILSVFILSINSHAIEEKLQSAKKPIKLTLKSAIEIALKNSPLLLEAQAGIKISESDYRKSLAAILPDINGGVSQARKVINLQTTGIPSVFPGNQIPNFPDFSTIEKVGPFNVFDARVNIDEIFLDLTAIFNIKASKQNIVATQDSFNNVRQLIQTNTVLAYIETLRLDAEVRKANSDVKTSKTLYKQAQDLKSAGMATELDVKRARVQLLNDNQTLLQSENNYNSAIMFLAKTMGLSPSTPLFLEDSLNFEHFVNEPVEDFLSLAMSKRSDFLSLKATEREYIYRIKSAKTQLLPKVGVHADYGASGLTPSDSVIPTWSIMGFIMVPIFNGGRTLANMAQSSAELTQVQSQIKDMSNQIEYEVRSSVLLLNTSAKQVEVAKEGVNVAADSLELSKDRFEAGYSDNVEVVVAQNDLARARENLIRALFNYNTARVSLAKAIGDISLVYDFD